MYIADPIWTINHKSWAKKNHHVTVRRLQLFKLANCKTRFAYLINTRTEYYEISMQMLLKARKQKEEYAKQPTTMTVVDGLQIY